MALVICAPGCTHTTDTIPINSYWVVVELKHPKGFNPTGKPRSCSDTNFVTTQLNNRDRHND